MEPSALETIARITARERWLIASRRGVAMDESPDKIADLADAAQALEMAGMRIRVVTTADLIAMKRSAADPARRRSKALRDQADIALLRGDVPDPDEGW